MQPGTEFYLADGKTLAIAIASKTDAKGAMQIEYKSDAGQRTIEYLAGETIALRDGKVFRLPLPAIPKTVNDLTVTINATDITEAFKEGFKMALGMEMMLSALGLDKDKLNAAIAQTGQIAVEAKAQLDRIEQNQAAILEILKKAQEDHAGTKSIDAIATDAKSIDG